MSAPLSEISAQNAVITTQVQLDANAYIDITLALKDLAPRQLFANVISSGAGGLRVNWVHLDSGEEAKLRTLLESYTRKFGGGKSASKPAISSDAPPTSHSGTRRVVKPRSGTDGGDAIPTGDSTPPAAPTHAGGNAGGTRRLVRPSASAITPFSDAAPADNQRIGTRRVVRPSQQGVTPFAEGAAKSPGDGGGDESRTNQVVIEPTDRFEKLIDVGVQPPSRPPPAREEARAAPAGDRSGSAQAIADPSGAQRIGDGSGSRTIREGSGAQAIDPSSDDSGAQAVGGKTGLIGRDGKMDIGASIRSHAKTVRASDLALRHERVRVLNMATIKQLIQEAVEEAAAHLTRALGEAERKRLLEEAEEGFQERLKAFEAEKLSAEVRSKRLHEQLEAAQRLLEEERKRTIKADQFTVSEEGLGEIEDRFRRFLDRCISAGGVPPDVEEGLRKVIAAILDSEREKIRAKELEAQNAKIELLERKIGRLAGTLDEAERQRDEAQRLAAFLEAQGGGLRNVFTAGMKDGDPNKARKIALMKTILDENRALRQSLGITLSDPNAEDPPAPVPEDATQKPTGKNIDTASIKREVKHDIAELKAAAAKIEHTPPPSPIIAETADTAVSDDSGGEAAIEINPDDEPWEVKPLANVEGGVNESGIKRMNVASLPPAPPLERKRPGGKA